MPKDVEILMEPYGDELSAAAERWTTGLRSSDLVREKLGSADAEAVQVHGPALPLRRRDTVEPLDAVLFDPAQNRSVEVRGELDGAIEVRSSDFRPNPTTAELQEALAVLRKDERFAPVQRRGEAVVYQPMPPLADVEQPDGTYTRRIALAIHEPRNLRPHQYVAVDLGSREVDWDAGHGLHPADGDCEAHLPVPVDSRPPDSGRDSVRVRVIRGGEELWSFVVVRPRASSPTHFSKGSGVELRYVRYRGRMVLWQAHVPILNVLYDDGVTFRDWQNQETPFQANGTEPVGPGWRVCTSPPATILEASDDSGNFQGVALHYDNGELRVVSELQAGWYRYISDWRLRDDGTIQPRFGFAGTKNPRTCMVHHHHAYWRFDFDIEGAGNDVVEQFGWWLGHRPVWWRISRETSRKRSGSVDRWRVRDAGTGRGYSITPGLADGTADSYGVSDLWFLRYHSRELDDGVGLVGGGPADTRCKLNAFLTGESIARTDVVVWYAGHFHHDEHHPSPSQGHIVGPELRPVNW
ncbi:hypothetical protein PZ938_13005 [Luteipulveratus sp. YIM 133132]|uniref:hypothetical protein n=1 Tax=Luteipulveratus flavus TaxID=3031728 RepID=UPI0023B05053|nr:hypothetical protein [Luteipulveratus sp. YIM 133132]MDE9366524.1 hypothetical protein [Luteipulveratus sp. YIM 133132]